MSGRGPRRRGSFSRLLGRHLPMLVVAAAVLVLSAVAYLRVPLLPDIGHELSMSVADLGLLTTAFALGRLCADIPVGRLSDLRSVAGMLAGAAAFLAAASLGLAAASDSRHALIAFFFLGVSSAAVNTTGMVYFAGVAARERRGRSLAVFSAALLGGQALGPAVGGLLASRWDWRTAVLIAAVAGFVVAPALAVRPLARRMAANRADGEPVADAEIAGAGVLVRERIILYFAPFAMFFALGALPQTLLPIIGADDFGLGAGVIGLVLGVGGVCRFVGVIAGGAISDRVSRKAALVPGMALQAAGVALLAWEGALWAWVAAIVVMSLASFSVSVAATMLVDRSGGRRAGRNLGPFRFVGDVGLIIGPFTASLVYENFGQRPTSLMVAGVLTAVAVASAIGLRETRWISVRDEPEARPDRFPHG